MTYSQEDLLYIPLGGSGEIGMNCSLYHYKNKWIMVDLGLTFADEKFPGIELLVPNLDFIDPVQGKVAGIAESEIDFKTTLIPYRVDTSWIEEKLIEMKDVLNLDQPPEIEKTCEKCAYLEGGKKF